jgi:hypothetical protein
MILTHDRAHERPETILTDLLAAHGLRRILLALASALIRQNRAPPAHRASRRRAQPEAALRRQLSAHLLRDIGIDP